MKKLTRYKIFGYYCVIVVLAIFIFSSLLILLNLKVPISHKFQFIKNNENYFLLGENKIHLEKTKVIFNNENINYIVWVEVGEKVENMYKLNILGEIPKNIKFENNYICTVITDEWKVLKLLNFSL